MQRDRVWIGWLVASWPVLAGAQVATSQEPGRTVLLRGRVLDAAGTPVAGAGIGVAPRAAWTTAETLKSPGTRTGADGRFRLAVAGPEEGGPAQACFLAAPNLASAELELPDGSEVEVDWGDLQLPEGTTLKGRVRGKEGKPVAGARVEAADLIAGPSGRTVFLSAATCGADGAFELPCALPLAARLTVSAPGHYTATLAPAGLGEPLVVELTPSGFVAGVVRDAEGKPGRGTVGTRHENGASTSSIPVAADGSFRFTLAHRGRFRLWAVDRARNTAATCPVLAGPVGDVQLRLESSTKAGGLAVRAVDAASGRALQGFKAGVRWLPAGIPAAVDYIAATTAAGADGMAHLTGPSSDNTTEGTVKVAAPGFAPCLVKAIQAKEGEERQVEAKLVKESTLEGRVVDETSGEPLAGARLWILRLPEEKPGGKPVPRASGSTTARPASAGITGPDGAFRLGELGAGTYELTVTMRQRLEAKSERLELGAEEARKDLVIKLGKGLAVSGRLTGVEVGPRWSVRLEPDGADPGARAFALRAAGGPGQPVAADGSFTVAGLKPGSYALRLSIQGAPRSGPPMDMLVDKLRLQEADLKRDFELAGDGPGELRGKFLVEGASLPRGRFVVNAVLQPKNAGGHAVVAGLSLGTQATRRALLAEDKSYTLELASGAYKLEVLDLLTSMVVHRVPEVVEVKSGSATTTDLAFTLVPLRVAFVPEGYVAASLAVACEDDGQDPRVAGLLTAIGGPPGRGGLPMSLAESPREVTLFVPPGDVKLTVHTRASVLVDRGGARGRAPEDPPLGEAEVTAKAGEPAQVTVKVAPAPATDGDTGKK